MDERGILLALTLNLLGVGVLYATWKGFVHRDAAFPWCGWGLLAAAWFCWLTGAGVEFGLVLGALFPGLTAWLFVWLNAKASVPATGRRGIPRGEPEATPSAGPSALSRLRPWLRNGLLFLLSVPFAAAATALASAALAELLPWSPLSRDVLVGLLMPVLWGLGAFWLCADRRPLRPLLLLSGGGLLSALALLGLQ